VETAFINVPVLPLTVIIMPSLSTFFLFPVPTIAAIQFSGNNAAWEVRPPRSVIIATAFFIAGTKSGFVEGATRISPSFIFRLFGARNNFTGPDAIPDLQNHQLG